MYNPNSPPPQPPEEPAYEFKAWPAWRYSVEPPHKGNIFQRAEDVPEGWLSLDELNELKERGAFEPLPAAPGSDEIITPQDDAAEPPLLPIVEKPRELTADQRKDAINKLIDDNSQKDLIAALELMNEARAANDEEEIEFGSNWGKPKLAEAIVDNGGPLEA